MRLLLARMALSALLPLLGSTASGEGAVLYWGADGQGAGGSWTADGVNWWDGTQAAAWTNGADAVFQGAGGEVSTYVFGPTASSLTFATPGYSLTTGGLKGGATGLVVNAIADTTISASLSDSSPFDAYGFTKTGGGTLTVAGVNFFDTVRVAEGEYVAKSNAAAFFSDFHIEAGATLTLAPQDTSSISVSSISGNGLVRPDAQARTVTAMFWGMDDFTGRIEDHDGGVLAMEYFSSSPGRLLSATGYTGATTITAGTLTLAAQGSIASSASVTINGSGRLRLDNLFSGSSSQRLGASAPVKLRNGGTLEITGSADGVSQAAGSLSTVGSGNLVLTNTAGQDVPAIQFSSFQRLDGSTLAIAGSGDVTLAGVANGATGIVTPAITMNNEWAVADGAGKLSAFTGYVEKFADGTPADHVKLAATSTTVDGPLTRASLNLVSNDAALDQQLMQQGQLTLASGGLLSSGTRAGTISGGSLTAPSELIITNANALTISSTIEDSGTALALTKSGAGTLFLDAANSYAGVTAINQGTLAIANSTALGNGSSAVFGGGTLQARGDFALTKNLAGVDGGGVRIDTNGHSVTAMGTISGGLSKTGSGALELRQAQLGSVSIVTGVVIAPDTTFGDATMWEGTRLDAGPAVDSILLLGSATLGIGGTKQASTLTLGSLSFSGGSGSTTLTIDFDLGSAAQDLLVLKWPFGLSSAGAGAFQFAFSDLGGLSTGVDYQVISFSSFGSSLNETSFALAPDLVKAGWKAQFQVDFFKGVSVNFSAIPEPGSLALLVLGLGGAGAALLQRRGRLSADLKSVRR